MSSVSSWLSRLAQAAAISLVMSPLQAQELGPPATVERVELERYAGLWYELARIPNGFQDQCAWGVTAEYSLRDDGRIDVINRCYKADGEADEAKGLARIEDPETNAKLKVSFFSIAGWRPIWGDYWILALGEDYEYAIVGSPDRKYGWVLSRERELAPADVDKVLALLADLGFSHYDFELTLQEEPAGQ